MLLLFDIDGTLLLSRGAGAEAVLAACHELFGREFEVERRSFAGHLDPLIWRDLCARNGVDDPERFHDDFRRTYTRLLGELFERDVGRAYALAGVRELLDALRERERAGDPLTLGLLTGNYPETGRMKVRAAGLDPAWFPVTVFGDDGPDRRSLVPVARERHAAHSGRHLDGDRVIVIGDTPRDVDCARAHGCRSLAVATGSHTLDELERAGADLTLGDLTDTAAVIDWFGLDGPPAARSR